MCLAQGPQRSDAGDRQRVKCATIIYVSGNGKLQNDRFTNSAAYIGSVYSNPSFSSNSAVKNLLPDYSKYLKR